MYIPHKIAKYEVPFDLLSKSKKINDFCLNVSYTPWNTHEYTLKNNFNKL